MAKNEKSRRSAPESNVIERLRIGFEEKPARLFWIFAATHLILWTVVSSLVGFTPPLDVIEGYVWGMEWPLGTYKHPPLQAWLLEIFAALTGRAPWAHFLLSQISVVAAFWAVWELGRRILDERAALIGVLLLEGIIYYNFTSPEFNPNVLQLPLWAFICLFFHRAVKGNRLLDWLAVGVFASASLYAKYSAFALLVVLAVLLIAHPEARKRLKSPGPYLALFIAVLLFLPHLSWLTDHNFLPFTYMKARAAEVRAESHFASILKPLGSALDQLAALLPAVVLFVIAFGRPKWAGWKVKSFDQVFLDTIAFGPFFLVLVLSLALDLKIRGMWCTPFWNCIGLWLMARFHPAPTPVVMRRFITAWLVVFIGMAAIYGASTILYPYLTHKTLRAQFPGRDLAETIDAEWHKRTPEPLQYVVGDVWLAGNVSYYTPERPHVLIGGNFDISPWIDPEDIRQKGGILIWCIQYCIGRGSEEMVPAFVRDDFPTDAVMMQEPLILPRLTGSNVKPVRVGWAILRPMAPQ